MLFGYARIQFIEKISRCRSPAPSFRMMMKTLNMKKTIALTSLLLILVMQGCVVKSIHPFFKESDVVLRNELVGSWLDNDSNRWNIHVNPFKPNSYELHYIKGSRDVAFAGNLFTLDGHLYLDLYPVSDNTEDMPYFDVHLVPTHSVAMVEKLTTSDVHIRWFNEEWLQSLFAQNKIRISHEMIVDANQKPGEDDGMYLLTATTDELQKFIVKYRDEAMTKFGDGDVSLRWTRVNQ